MTMRTTLDIEDPLLKRLRAEASARRFDQGILERHYSPRSTDADFARFPHLRYRNPLKG